MSACGKSLSISCLAYYPVLPTTFGHEVLPLIGFGPPSCILYKDTNIIYINI